MQFTPSRCHDNSSYSKGRESFSVGRMAIRLDGVPESCAFALLSLARQAINYLCSGSKCKFPWSYLNPLFPPRRLHLRQRSQTWSGRHPK